MSDDERGSTNQSIYLWMSFIHSYIQIIGHHIIIHQCHNHYHHQIRDNYDFFWQLFLFGFALFQLFCLAFGMETRQR